MNINRVIDKTKIVDGEVTTINKFEHSFRKNLHISTLFEDCKPLERCIFTKIVFKNCQFIQPVVAAKIQELLQHVSINDWSKKDYITISSLLDVDRFDELNRYFTNPASIVKTQFFNLYFPSFHTVNIQGRSFSHEPPSAYTVEDFRLSTNLHDIAYFSSVIVKKRPGEWRVNIIVLIDKNVNINSLIDLSFVSFNSRSVIKPYQVKYDTFNLNFFQNFNGIVLNSDNYRLYNNININDENDNSNNILLKLPNLRIGDHLNQNNENIINYNINNSNNNNIDEINKYQMFYLPFCCNTNNS